MSTLTVRQHQVPDFYLTQWQADPKIGTVQCYDLLERKHFTPAPKNILAGRYFYEEDPANPDNRVENHLSVKESEWSDALKQLSAVDFSDIDRHDMRAYSLRASKALTPDICREVRTFANYQYLRVPGVIAAKRNELQASALTADELEHHLNPGRFVESGVAYTQARFQGLRMQVSLSLEEDFITSDWPCFDMKDSDMAPAIGEDIGRQAGVVCYLPLNPRMAATFFHESLFPSIRRVPEGFATVISPAEVRNMNMLVIQQAVRYVVTRRESNFVFKIADRRKKASKDWANRAQG